jgi:hypothetical protein
MARIGADMMKTSIAARNPITTRIPSLHLLQFALCVLPLPDPIRAHPR